VNLTPPFRALSASVCLLAAAWSAVAQTSEVIDKRIFGVFPNYRMADGNVPFQPIPSSRKFVIAAHDAFDPPIFFTAIPFAGLNHLSNNNPSFGQGLKGFSQRYGATLADQMISNLLTEGVLSSAFHEDPRYFRKGHGSGLGRVAYALSRLVVCRRDSGSFGFNFPEFGGNAIGAGVANAYYRDGRSLSGNLQRFGMGLATDAWGNILKEFWPDIKKRIMPKRARS